MKQRSQNIILLIVSTVCSLLFLEGILRGLYPYYKNYNSEMWRYGKDIKKISGDARVSHEHQANKKGEYYGVTIATNSNGWRDREYTERPEKYRLMILGDSITLGWGVKNEDSYPRILERLLKSKGRDVEVLNTGVGNYNTQNEVYAYLKKGQQFHPHEIVVGYYINDTEVIKPTQNPVQYFLMTTYLFSLAADKWLTFRAKVFENFQYTNFYSSLYQSSFRGRHATEEAFSVLSQHCQKEKIRLSVAIIPEMHQFKNYPFPEVAQFVQSVGAKQQFPVADLLPNFLNETPSSLWVSMEDAHPNAAGQAIIASGIYDSLLKDQDGVRRSLAGG